MRKCSLRRKGPITSVSHIRRMYSSIPSLPLRTLSSSEVPIGRKALSPDFRPIKTHHPQVAQAAAHIPREANGAAGSA
eukprot:44544-Eustigmatos_ZCMA.PRE.1